MLDKKSFETNSIWVDVLAVERENSGEKERTRWGRFRDFAAQRFISDSRTQKTICRAFQELSIDARLVGTMPKIVPLFVCWIEHSFLLCPLQKHNLLSKWNKLATNQNDFLYFGFFLLHSFQIVFWVHEYWYKRWQPRRGKGKKIIMGRNMTKSGFPFHRHRIRILNYSF